MCNVCPCLPCSCTICCAAIQLRTWDGLLLLELARVIGSSQKPVKTILRAVRDVEASAGDRLNRMSKVSGPLELDATSLRKIRIGPKTQKYAALVQEWARKHPNRRFCFFRKFSCSEWLTFLTFQQACRFVSTSLNKHGTSSHMLQENAETLFAVLPNLWSLQAWQLCFDCKTMSSSPCGRRGKATGGVNAGRKKRVRHSECTGSLVLRSLFSTIMQEVRAHCNPSDVEHVKPCFGFRTMVTILQRLIHLIIL